MRAMSIMKHYLNNVLGKSLLLMATIYTAFAVILPLLLSMAFKEQGSMTSDLYFSMVIYMCVYVGIYAVQYTRMQLAMGATRKSLWLFQTVLGSVILAVVAIILSAVGNWLIFGLGNLLANLTSVNINYSSEQMSSMLFGQYAAGDKYLMMGAICLYLMSLVQFCTHYVKRWKSPSLIIGLALGALLTWSVFSYPAALIKVLDFMFVANTLPGIAGKLLVQSIVLLGLCYIPMRRLPVK